MRPLTGETCLASPSPFVHDFLFFIFFGHVFIFFYFCFLFFAFISLSLLLTPFKHGNSVRLSVLFFLLPFFLSFLNFFFLVIFSLLLSKTFREFFEFLLIMTVSVLPGINTPPSSCFSVLTVSTASFRGRKGGKRLQPQQQKAALMRLRPGCRSSANELSPSK